MAHLVVGVVGDILWEVVINCFDRLPICVIASSQLGVLLPQVRLDQFGRGQKAHDIDIATTGTCRTQSCGAHSIYSCDQAGGGRQERRAETQTAKERSPCHGMRRNERFLKPLQTRESILCRIGV